MKTLALMLGIFLSVTTYVQGEARVKGGAIVERLGEIKLVNNVVVIRKNISDFKMYEKGAKDMLEKVDQILNAENEKENVEILEIIRKGLYEMVGSRKKRSLLPFVGKLLNGLFGVATDGDVERERERLDKIEKWAKEYGHVLDNVVDEINNHVQVFNNLTNTLNFMSTQVYLRLGKYERKLAYNELALKLENVRIDVKGKIAGLLMAHQGIANVEIITPVQLEKLIEYSIVNFGFQPIDIDLISYYNMMTLKVVHDTCFIFLPFNNKDTLLAHKIIPFPMKLNDTKLILEGNSKVILESKNDLINIMDVDKLDKCVELKTETFICNMQNFYLEPLNKHKCIKFLLNDGENNCKYVEFESNFYVSMLKRIYVFTEYDESVIINCKGKKEERFVMNNVHAFDKDCKIKILDNFYYTPTIFRSVYLDSEVNLPSVSVNLSKISIPQINIKMKEIEKMSTDFFVLYKKHFMPYITLLLIPATIIIAIIIFVLIRKSLVNKVTEISDLLKGIETINNK